MSGIFLYTYFSCEGKPDNHFPSCGTSTIGSKSLSAAAARTMTADIARQQKNLRNWPKPRCGDFILQLPDKSPGHLHYFTTTLLVVLPTFTR